MCKVLVTGATGFIGSHLVDALLQRGDQVRCLVRPTSDLRWLSEDRVEMVRGDCRDPGSLMRAVAGVDLIFHAAGVVRAQGCSGYFENNSVGTANLLQACLQNGNGLERFVFISSQAVAGPSPNGRFVGEDDPPRPVSTYGWSKLSAEREVLGAAGDLPVAVVRPSPVYGPRDTDFYTLFRIARMGVWPIMGGGRRYLQMIHVHDVVRGCLQAASQTEALGQVFHLASDGGYCWEEIGEAIGAACDRRALPIRIHEWAWNTVSGVVELWAAAGGKAALFNREKVEEMSARWWLSDTTRARERLGFEPSIPLRRGTEETARWYRDQGWL